MRKVEFSNPSFSDDKDSIKSTSSLLRRRRRSDEKYGQANSHEQNRYILFLCGVIVLSVILSFSSLLCSGIVIYMMHFHNEEGSTQLCLQSTVPRRKFNNLLSILSFTSEGYCANSRSQIDALFKAVIDMKTKEYGYDMVNDASSRVFSSDMINAHVLITGNGDLHRNKRKHGEAKIITGGRATHSIGVTLGQYHIVIKTPGTYYVYSHILFNVPNKNSPSRQTHTISSRFKNSSEPFKILLENEHTFQRKMNTVRSSFLADFFELAREDEIFVRVSNLNYVSKREDVNFLGLYLIS